MEIYDISEATVEEIRGQLTTLGKGRWTNLYMELQDDGQYLYISVEIPETNSDVDNKDILKIIKSVVEPKIPQRPNDYPWSAGLKKSGRVVASVFPGAVID